MEPVAFQLDIPEHWNVHPVFHVSKLRKYNKDDVWPSQLIATPPEPIVIDDYDEYEVSKITDDLIHRLPNGKAQRRWLVHFKGYGDEEAQYLPESSINTGGMQNSIWLKYERKRKAKLHEAAKVNVLAIQPATESKPWRLKVESFRSENRPTRVLIMNATHDEGERLVHTLQKRMPNAQIVVTPHDVQGTILHAFSRTPGVTVLPITHKTMSSQRFLNALTLQGQMTAYDLIITCPPKAATKQARRVQYKNLRDFTPYTVKSETDFYHAITCSLHSTLFMTLRPSDTAAADEQTLAFKSPPIDQALVHPIAFTNVPAANCPELPELILASTELLRTLRLQNEKSQRDF